MHLKNNSFVRYVLQRKVSEYCMFKKIIKFSLGFSTFSFITTGFINNNQVLVNKIHYSNVIEKWNPYENTS